MGAAKNAILKVSQEIGAIKKQGKPVTAQNLGLELEKSKKKVTTATMAEKQDAARRRSRRIGSRSLLSGGRLASAENEGTQTTLGA